MLRFSLIILGTAAVVSFSLANAHHVVVSFVIGAPVEIRLIVLLLCAFIIGMAVPVFYRLTQNVKQDQKMKRKNETRRSLHTIEQDLLKR